MKYYDPDGRGIEEFWAKFSQAVKYKLSLDLGVALKADCKGKGAGFSLNLISSSVVSGDLSQNPEMFSGEKSSGASLETPGLALGVETTVSPTTKSTSVEYQNGIPRFTSTQSNSKTEKISLNIGGVDLSKSSTVTRTKDNYANEVNSTPEVTQYEVGGSMASFQFGAGVLLDLNLDVLLIFEALGEL